MDAHPATQHPAQFSHDTPQEKAAQFQQAYEPYHPQHPSATGPTVLSITRRVALGVLAVIVLLVLAVIGLGAGLGVSQRDLHQVKGDLEVAQAVLSSGVTGAPTTIPAPTTATTVATSATAAPSVAADVQCPKVNGTIYTASTGGKRFRRLCGLDYGGEGEADDIGNVKTRNMDGCIDACASRGNCTGAGWGVIKGDEGPTHSCWMKTNLTKPHKATPDWGFAVLVPTAEES